MTIPIFDDLSVAHRTILQRIPFDEIDVPAALLNAIEQRFGARLTPAEAVDRIVRDVRKRGDDALRDWSQRLDDYAGPLEVPIERCVAALACLDPDLRSAIELAIGELTRFHQRQVRTSWIEFGAEGALGQIITPLRRVGIYVPGGAAPLPSSLLHAAIPARVAGVEEVIVCTPPQRNGDVDPTVLAAAAAAGVTRVFAIGGAQAIAAMAYGTASVPRVDKIVGPGNLFVVLAKRAVYGVVGIESLPGPTETLVIADAHADPRLVAADLLAQAEHALASAILVTPDRTLAVQVQAEIARQLELLPAANAAAAAAAISGRGGIVLVPDLDAAFAVANDYAPEHLCLLIDDPWRHIGKVRNAGGVFLGERSFEVLGDYVAGPSHIMPTGGTARFASPVNVDDFRKVISLVALNDAALKRIGPAAARLADAEGLAAHAAAVRMRMSLHIEG
ncbi:MAG: histidinol dehydrogenase [Roseiflexus sp.]|nr:histidinol dehydrogenase [Roseiflexus sp.]MCS7288134.1 histidinol dehydrogenase [Roseiflexus sp.]MDW8147216.1 histidinol dehydrogenase [Roseiflexaceae bacterium]MDW8233075.1 histidinol dehydrogenase [Roseiflexaceae bacterium]